MASIEDLHLADLKIFHAGSMRKVSHEDGTVLVGGQEGGIEGNAANVAARNFQAGKLRIFLIFQVGSLLEMHYHIDRARVIFGVRTEKAAVNKALELAIVDDEIIQAHELIGGKGGVVEEVFE